MNLMETPEFRGARGAARTPETPETPIDFSKAELMQLFDIREDLRRRIPVHYSKLVASFRTDTNSGRCISMIGALIEEHYPEASSLFQARSHSVAIVLLAE